MLERVITLYETPNAVWSLNLDRDSVEYCTRHCTSLAVWQLRGADWVNVERLGRGGPAKLPQKARAMANRALNRDKMKV